MLALSRQAYVSTRWACRLVMAWLPGAFLRRTPLPVALGLFTAGIPRIARGIACVARVALFIAGVVRITLGRFIPTAGTGFYNGILLEARLTKLSADARRIPTTPPEVLAFLHFQHLHCLHHLHRHHD